MSKDSIRTGIGLDYHRLERGQSLILGGVRLDHDKGIVAHSDGDVLVHAICDALLGAAGLEDLGAHFPDSDPSYKGVSSLKLLGEVLEKLADLGYRVLNVDSTLILKAPKISPYRSRMVAKLEEVVEAEVNIKATSTEGLGAVGEERGIAAQAVATITTETSR